MASSAPNLVDWLTLAVATTGTLLSTWMAVWAKKREEREVIDLHIDWEWMGDGGPNAELPFVYIHNRSSNAVSIIELSWFSGALRKKPWRYTAKWSEGPEDINFPYDVAPGSFLKLFLDEDGAVHAFDRVRKWANVFGLFGRSSLWLKVSTMRGNAKFIAAERALPWKRRPKWLTGEDKE
jgi:hypothetical protein